MRLLKFLLAGLLLHPSALIAQVVDPIDLAPDKSGRSMLLAEPFRVEQEGGGVQFTYEIQAGTYQAEYVSNVGTFYRGPAECLSTSSYAPNASNPGSSFGLTRKTDCGILVDPMGKARIYQYPRKIQMPKVRLADRAAMKRAVEAGKAQEAKILLLHGMAPSSELSNALVGK